MRAPNSTEKNTLQRPPEGSPHPTSGWVLSLKAHPDFTPAPLLTQKLMTTSSLTCYKQECKWSQSVWRAPWQSVSKPKIHKMSTLNSCNLFLHPIPQTNSHKRARADEQGCFCTLVCSRKKKKKPWKPHLCPSLGDWLNKWWSPLKMEASCSRSYRCKCWQEGLRGEVQDTWDDPLDG